MPGQGKPFEKGKSGNPRGRPKKDFALATSTQLHAETSLDILVDIALTCEAPAVRVSACKASGRLPNSG
ncbi:MAG: DUF5681 domain-containing protein [Methyloceanibacter sp.]